MPGPTDKPPTQPPILIFDGDCAFCRAAVDRWSEAIGGQVAFAPYQSVAADFPQIDQADFRRAIQYVDHDGLRVAWGGGGVSRKCRLRAECWLLWLYTWFPPFAFAAEAIYHDRSEPLAPHGRIARLRGPPV